MSARDERRYPVIPPYEDRVAQEVAATVALANMGGGSVREEAHQEARCQRCGEPIGDHSAILNGSVAGWAHHPECP